MLAIQKCSNTSQSTTQPPQGLFSGARIFQSPTGAYLTNPNLTGQVQFGVTTKYDNNGFVTGDVNMHFNAANLEFDATTLTSLVIANGNKATLRGTGTINGTPGYSLLVTGLDGGSGGDDLIRFQIKNGSTVVYDSQPNAVDTATPTTPITAGQIIVH